MSYVSDVTAPHSNVNRRVLRGRVAFAVFCGMCMNIGIFVGHIAEELGGNYTFQNSIVRALCQVQSRHDFIIFHYGEMNSGLEIPPHITTVRLHHYTLAHIFNKIIGKGASLLGKKHRYSLLSTTAASHRIDLMWFITHSFESVDIPYICTVLDLAHRVHPFFPEVGSTWEEREELFRTMIPRAAYVISGTEAGKEEIVRFYHPDEERVRVIPFPVPPWALECKEITPGADSVNRPYVVYPAQFWPHKNHIVVLHALKLLQDSHRLDMDVVFCGSDKGNLAYVREVTKNLGLENRVRFSGFVSTHDLYSLYKNAFAMVYPSLFGPDNLPPLEAFAIGCPVIASKLAGAEEQLGDAALIVDPLNEEDIARAVMKLHHEPELREKLIGNGKDRVKQLTSSAYVHKIIGICDEFELFRRCWSRQETYIQL